MSGAGHWSYLNTSPVQHYLFFKKSANAFMQIEIDYGWGEEEMSPSFLVRFFTAFPSPQML